MQRHIDLQKAKPLIPPSEKTSIYMKDERGILLKVNHKKQFIRPGGPNGLQFIGDLPGLEVMGKVYDHKMANTQNINPVDAMTFDSDDEKAAMVDGPLLPTKRPRQNPCNILKEVDLYGITPTMVVGGQNQFKSWWGVFFSLLVFGSVGFYIYQKVLFFMANQNTYFIQRNVLTDYSTEEGQKVRDLLESQVTLELEINYNQNKIQSYNLNQTQVIQRITDFFQYVIFEVHQIEIDAVKQTEVVHNVQQIDPTSIMMIDSIGPLGTPRFLIDPTLIKLRGDPFIEQRALNGFYNERTYNPNLIYNDLENIENFQIETQSIEINTTLRQLQANESEAISQNESEATSQNESANNQQKKLGFSLSNPITTYVTIRTNQTLIENQALGEYLYQAEAYLNSLKYISNDNWNEYLRRKQVQGVNAKFQELWYFQNIYYQQFIQNCSDLMITVVMTDRFLAQNNDNMGVYINRTQRLYQRQLGLQNLSQEQSFIRLQMHQVNFDQQFNWPSTSWIYRDKTDMMNSYNNTFLQVDKELTASDWLSTRVTFPLNAYQTSSYGNVLFKVQFYMNPITTTYQKQVIKHWILDQLSDLGGFILFAFLLFYIPCLIIQQKLYEAFITQERYRVKFNKILQGIKDKKFKKKEPQKQEDPQKEIEEDIIEEAESSEELDSEQRRQEDEAQLEKNEMQKPEKMQQIYIQEGGDFEDNLQDQYDFNDDEIGAISERHQVHDAQISKQTIRNSEEHESKQSLKKRKNKSDNKSILTTSSKKNRFEEKSDKTPGQAKVEPKDNKQLEPQQTQRALIENEDQVDEQTKRKQGNDEVMSSKSKKSKQSKTSKKHKIEDDKISKKSGTSKKSKTSKKSRKEKDAIEEQTNDEEQKETPIQIETPQPEDKKKGINLKSMFGTLFNKEPLKQEPTNDKDQQKPDEDTKEEKKEDNEKEQEQEQEKKGVNLRSMFGSIFNKNPVKQESTNDQVEFKPDEEKKDEIDLDEDKDKDKDKEQGQDQDQENQKQEEQEQSIKQKFGSFFSNLMKKIPEKEQSTAAVVDQKLEEEEKDEKDKHLDSQTKEDENKLIPNESDLKSNENQQENENKDENEKVKAGVFSAFGSFFTKIRGLTQKKNNEIQEQDIEKGILEVNQQDELQNHSEKNGSEIGAPQSSQNKNKAAAIVQPEQVLSQKSSKKLQESNEKQSSVSKMIEEKKFEKIQDSVISHALPDNQPNDNIDADYQPQDKPFYKPYEILQISSFQIIRLAFTPSIFYTYYQLTLQRLIYKAFGKAKRELEITTLMKRVRDSDNLCKSFETYEVFKGLKKKYKYDYSNVVNVSLDTVNSIIEENQRPYLPADPPYMRKKLKTYRMGDDGLIHGVMEFEPYELDKETIKIIARTVWKKLRDDAEINYQTQKNIDDQMENQKKQYEIGLEFDDDKPPGPKSKSRNKHKKGIQSELGFPINQPRVNEIQKPNQNLLSEKILDDEQEDLPKGRGTIFDQKSRPSMLPSPVLDSTIFSKIEGQLTKSKIEENALKALRKQVLKKLKNKTPASSSGQDADGDKTPRKLL